MAHTDTTWQSQFSHRCNLIDGRTRIWPDSVRESRRIRDSKTKDRFREIGVGILARPESRETASRLSRLFLFWRGTPPQNRSDSRAASEYSAHVIETMTSANGPFTFSAHRRACHERASGFRLHAVLDNTAEVFDCAKTAAVAHTAEVCDWPKLAAVVATAAG